MTFFSRLNFMTLIIGVGFSISACGQKGPLFMPARLPAISTPYPVAVPDKSAIGNENESTRASGNLSEQN